MHLLVIEDDAGYGDWLQGAVADADRVNALTLTVAHTLSEGISQLRASAYAAVILDLNLPDSRGVDSFRRVSAAAPRVPVVILTGSDDEESAVVALREGAQECLLKDRIDASVLADAVRHSLERHGYNETLRTTESRYRSLVEGTVQGILIHGSGIVRFANRSLCQLLGADRPDELIGRTIWQFIYPEDRLRVMEYALARADGRPASERYDIRICRCDGAVRWVDCAVSIIDWDAGMMIQASLVDITDRKLAEQELRGSNERFRLLVDNIKEAFVIVEVPGGRAVYLSRMWEEIWGRAIEDAYADPELWFRTIHPDDQALVMTVDAAAQEGTPIARVFRVLRPDQTIRWVRARTFPVRADDGEVYCLVGLVEDITAHRQIEDQLRQAQKMEAIGVLAGGIAHDFNNLLLVISGYAELMADTLPMQDPLRVDVEEIRAATQSAADLTGQLLAFSRRQILQPRLMNVNDVARRVEQMLRRIIGEDIAVELRLKTPIRPIHADPGQIEQMILNLAINARDAMPDGGRLVIETTDIAVEEEPETRDVTIAPGEHVTITVSDTGIGMDETTRQRLFEPFFTTKPPGRGTGLGLATVYGIVKQSNGSIQVYSEPGRGTTFQVHLPAARDPQPRALKATEGTAVDGTETILVVEDQHAVRRVLTLNLERYGYTVLAAASGQEAITIAQRREHAIALLLTDVVLAESSGRAVADAIYAERPDIRVLFMSGYTDHAIVNDGLLEAGLHFIQKPFNTRALLLKIREVLA